VHGAENARLSPPEQEEEEELLKNMIVRQYTVADVCLDAKDDDGYDSSKR
jgi:hypothetical protein